MKRLQTTIALAATFFLVALPLVAARGAGAADAPVARVAVVNTLRPIVIDGKIGEEEWSDAATLSPFVTKETHSLAETQTRVYLTYDDRYLYIAFHSEIPEIAKQNPDARLLYGFLKKTAVSHDNHRQIRSDDHFMINIIPDYPKAERYYMRVNGLGTVYDNAVSVDRVSRGAWDPAWEMRSQVGMEGWTLETRMPLEELGVDRIDDGEVWHFQIWRGWKLLQDQTDCWPALSLAHRRKGRVRGYGDVLFRRDSGITVGTDVFREISPGKLRLSGVLRNRGPQKTEVRLLLSTKDKPLLEKAFSLPAGGVVPFDLLANLIQVDETFTYQVTDDTGAVAYRETIPFRPPAPAVTSFHRYPSDKLATVRWELRSPDAPLENTEAVVEILEKESGETRLSERMAPLPSVRGVMELSVASLPPGDYLARVTLRRNGQALLANDFDYLKRSLPEWYHNDLGLGDKVPPPWTPLKVDSDKVSMWGRAYAFDGAILPRQIVNQGREILASPMAFEATDAGGRVYRSRAAKVEWGDRSDIKASFTRTETVGPARIVVDGYIEFDGMQWMELEIQPTKDAESELRSLSIVIPMKQDTAYLMNTYDNSLRATGRIPEEGFSSPMGIRWVGWEEGGLQVFAETSATWRVGDLNSQFRIVPGDKVTELRLNLVGEPYRIGEPLRLALGFIVTPVKRTRPDHRELMTGGVPISLDVKSERAQTKAEYFAQAVKNHKGLYAVSIWAQGWWQMDPKHEARPDRSPFYPLMTTDLGADYGCRKSDYGLTVWTAPYGRLYQTRGDSPEYQQFADEWIAEFYKPDPREQSHPIVCQNARTFQDFTMHGYKQLLDNTAVKFTYLDVCRPRACNNLRHGCGVRMPDGRALATFNFLGTRQMLRRLYTIIKEKDPTGGIFFHSSGNIAMPVLSFCDGIVDGEHGLLDRKKNRGYENILDPATFAAEYSAQNCFGPYTIFLSQLERSGAIKKDEWDEVGYQPVEYLLGMIFLHNSQMWFTAYTPPEPCAKLYGAFDREGLTSDWKFIGYWRRPVADLPETVKASVYVAPDGRRAFLLAMNFADEPITLDIAPRFATIGLKPAALGAARQLYRDGPVRLDGDTLKDVTIAAKNFRLFILEQRTPKP